MLMHQNCFYFHIGGQKVVESIIYYGFPCFMSRRISGCSEDHTISVSMEDSNNWFAGQHQSWPDYTATDYMIYDNDDVSSKDLNQIQQYEGSTMQVVPFEESVWWDRFPIDATLSLQPGNFENVTQTSAQTGHVPMQSNEIQGVDSVSSLFLNPLPTLDDMGNHDTFMIDFDDIFTLDYSPEEQSKENNNNRNRPRKRLPDHARTTLQTWFLEHEDDPYLGKEEVYNLSQKTNLTEKQVRTFFANLRARKQPPVVSPKGTDYPEPQTIKEKPSVDAHAQQDPMQRFLSSSPEDEGIPESTLKRASADYKPAALQQKSSIRGTEATKPDTMSIADTTMGSNSGSNSSHASSHASIDSATNRAPRRGRKRHRDPFKPTVKPVIRARTDPTKIYQCTFCPRDFAQKYDWRRHEESVHLPQTEWVCMPNGPAIRGEPSGPTCGFCAFCDLPNPPADHFDTHNCAGCLQLPLISRTFTRKDKLLQHANQVHKTPQLSRHMQEWHRPVSRSIHLCCGLCGLALPTWSARIDHIASHFQSEIDMSFWMGAPGGVTPLPTTLSPSAALPPGNQQPINPTMGMTSPILPTLPTPPTPTDPHPNLYSPLTSLFARPPVPWTDGKVPMGLHPCVRCRLGFHFYIEALCHERQVHGVWKLRTRTFEQLDVRVPGTRGGLGGGRGKGVGVREMGKGKVRERLGGEVAGFAGAGTAGVVGMDGGDVRMLHSPRIFDIGVENTLTRFRWLVITGVVLDIDV
ncbi:hypothetical protein M501DRAFT_1034803 [Patellaria atrata CBS 101060]|uniref:Homeobox domain-containing protein n=1 Tax=Patellaria atrata CBS 101060 TaxID=1346257 RepID=A0A9P4S2B3_9PEZI|nr:hypothetical protein M501DRAFT_1034803 [Patellaria atrata CBS 101060]